MGKFTLKNGYRVKIYLTGKNAVKVKYGMFAYNLKTVEGCTIEQLCEYISSKFS